MFELGAGQVDDRHQVAVRSESTRSCDRCLDFRVDGFGGAVGQTQPDGVDDAVQVIAYSRPLNLSRLLQPRSASYSIVRFGLIAASGL